MATDEQLRKGVRANLKVWSEKLNCHGDAEKKLERKMKFVRELRSMPIAVKTYAANQQHYEVDTDFFLTVLGKRLKYSSCYYKDGVDSLDEAEEAMLELVCQRARVEDSFNVMDLGCGWGITGLYIVEKFPKCTVTCVSNSLTQAKHINKQAARKGYENRLKCITADANVYSSQERFDRIISIEMFEHMKNYDSLMARVASWLKPSGMLFTQILCHREYSYHFKQKENSAQTEWMARYFFTGGTMPSSELFLYFQKDLSVVNHWNINGNHYSKTLEAWLVKLDANKSKVMEIFRRNYSEEEAVQQVFNWRLFFIYCSEAFKFNGGNDWLVSHHLFQKNPNCKL